MHAKQMIFIRSKLTTLLLLTVMFLPVLPTLTAAESTVVVTIKPLHSLVQGVMGDTNQAVLLMEDGQSPHGVMLKPSWVRLMNRADVVFYIDDSLETFVDKALDDQTKGYPLAQRAHINKLSNRDWSENDIHHSDDEHHEEHLDDEHHENHLDEEHHDNHTDDEHHDNHFEQDNHNDSHAHHAGETDTHIWLDPDNAKQMVIAIAAKLSELYPDNSKQYQRNAEHMIERINQLTLTISVILAPVKDKPFIVFHDAYQYFERYFGLQALGSVMVSPERPMNAGHLRQMRHIIDENDVRCVFSEPQFSSRHIETITQGNDIDIAVLDPLAQTVAAGEDLYVIWMQQLAQNIYQCLR